MAITVLTKNNYEEEVLRANCPVLLDFWAGWCGPCRMLSPIVDALAEEVSSVKIGKVNIDEQLELAQKFGVMSIPTLVVLKDGKVADTKVGLQSKESILAMLGK